MVEGKPDAYREFARRARECTSDEMLKNLVREHVNNLRFEEFAQLMRMAFGWNNDQSIATYISEDLREAADKMDEASVLLDDGKFEKFQEGFLAAKEMIGKILESIRPVCDKNGGP